MCHQSGPHKLRPATVTFVEMVKESGGRVRGTKHKNSSNSGAASTPAAGGGGDGVGGGGGDDGGGGEEELLDELGEYDIRRHIWPLYMVEFGDSEQMDTLYELMHATPLVIQSYLVCYYMCLCVRMYTTSHSELPGMLLYVPVCASCRLSRTPCV